MTIKGSLTVRKISGTTGRGGYHIINDRPTAHSSVASFVQELCSTDRARYWGCLRLRSGIARSIRSETKRARNIGIQGRYYRGRRFHEGEEPQSTSDFGPPPPDRRVKGRYNEFGGKVLYLCRNLETLVAECSYTPEKPCLYAQTFDIQLETARILKLNADLEKYFPHLHYLLLESEYAAEGTTFVKFPYRATHFIAYLCRKLDIGAVEYPSVRGGYKDNLDAVNLVVFEPYCDSVVNMAIGKPFKCEYNQSCKT